MHRDYTLNTKTYTGKRSNSYLKLHKLKRLRLTFPELVVGKADTDVNVAETPEAERDDAVETVDTVGRVAVTVPVTA